MVEDGAAITFGAEVAGGAVLATDLAKPTLAQIRAAGAGYQIYIHAAAGLLGCFCVREKPGVAGQLQWDWRNVDKSATTEANVKLTACRFPTSGAGAVLATLAQVQAAGGGGGAVNVIRGATDPSDANDGEDNDFYSNTQTLALFHKEDGKWEQIAGGGGTAQTDGLLNLYTDANGQGVAGTYAFGNALPIDSDWEHIVAEVADDGETGTPAQLPVAVLAHLRMKWVETANLNGGRTHSYAFGNRFLEYGGSGNTGIYGRIEGTAESATHITIGFNSGGALYTLDAVRGRGRAGPKGDTGAAGKLSFGPRLDVAANQNALNSARFDVDLSDKTELWVSGNPESNAENSLYGIYAWRLTTDDNWGFNAAVFSAVDNNGFQRSSTRGYYVRTT